MFASTTRIAAATAVLVMAVNADVYLHNMRGGNNRLDEARRDRNNANRVFDSQNNNRGGSNVGSLYYFKGEKLDMEWTVQHGCGNKANDCQMVIQYMCDDKLRDGVTTRTIPQTPAQCLNNDCNNDVRYGMHESYDYYMNCKYRYRNRGLFTADRNLNGRTARFTRQNNNGNRNGYECPEERDYYPYWHPTDWIDIAVYTTSESTDDFQNRCNMYTSETENLKGRYFCSMPDKYYHYMIRERNGNGNNGFIPNTKILCEGVNGTGGLNAENSPMMAYLSQADATDAEELSDIIEEEFEACSTKMQSILDQCPNTTDYTTCATYSTFFDDSKIVADRGYLTENDLDTACPICNGTDVLHPYSTCSMCAPIACKDSVTAMVTDPDTGVTACPAAYSPDSLSTTMAGMCIKDTCKDSFVSVTLDSIKTNQDCRTKATEGKFVVDSDGGSKTCKRRDSPSKSCRLNADRAVWKQAPSHADRIPGTKAPVCRSAVWSRENHLGNGMGGQQVGHKLDIPEHAHERCAFRVRYNITTKDYLLENPHYSINSTTSALESSTIDSTYNKNNGNNPAKIALNKNVDVPAVASDMPYENARGYLWKNNPKVSIFDFDELVMYCYKAVGETLRGATTVNVAPAAQVRNGDYTWCYPRANSTDHMYRAKSAFCPGSNGKGMLKTVKYETDGSISETTATGNNCDDQAICTDTAGTPARDCEVRAINNNGVRNQNGNDNSDTDDRDFRLQLAINTNQFGRTFQDRTHSHAIRETTAAEEGCSDIYALNVRGKRGNIVQTFPGTEYDFVPNILEVNIGSCIHFQWTGSNTNPNNNDGQGKRGTDRSNIVLLEKNRGEGAGGRGVSRFGGAGANGATWTTLNMEPGLENYASMKQNMAPEMFDFPCDTRENRRSDGTIYAMPFAAWKWCANLNPMSTDAEYYKAYDTETSSCPTSYSPYPTDSPLVCVLTTAVGSLKVTARQLTTSWTGIGQDPNDPDYATKNYNSTSFFTPNTEKFGSLGNSHPEHIDNITKWDVWGLTYDQAINLATLDNIQFRGEMSELDDAGTYFDMGAKLITGALGRFYYLCTRNNNFSNRSQKGTIVVDWSRSETMMCGMGACEMKTATGGGVKVPANQDVGPMTVGEIQADITNGGDSNAASDILSVKGALNTQMQPQWVEMGWVDPTATNRHRRQTMENSTNGTGLWMSTMVPDPANVGDENYSITFNIKSPGNDMLWKTAEDLDDEHKYMCIWLKWDDITLDTHFTIATWNVFEFSWPVPNNYKQTLSEAFEDNRIEMTVAFPKNSDTPFNCTGDMFKATQTVDPATDTEFTITIPTLAVWKIGDVEHFQGNQARLCFEESNQEACDNLKSSTVSSSECDGENCVVSCSKNCEGYYRVKSADKVPMIVGITLAVVILCAAIVGSALYFRRNPEKWDALKSYGPNKYKSVKLSMQNEI